MAFAGSVAAMLCASDMGSIVPPPVGFGGRSAARGVGSVAPAKAAKAVRDLGIDPLLGEQVGVQHPLRGPPQRGEGREECEATQQVEAQEIRPGHAATPSLHAFQAQAYPYLLGALPAPGALAMTRWA